MPSLVQIVVGRTGMETLTNEAGDVTRFGYINISTTSLDISSTAQSL
jgi:hypothetical protein